MRSLALGLILLLPGAAFATNAASPAAPAAPAVYGVVADPTGAIVPGAEVDLVDTNGAVAGTIHSDGEGNFQLVAPHAGSFTLVVSEPGFETVRTPVVPSIATVAVPLAGLTMVPKVRSLFLVMVIGWMIVAEPAAVAVAEFCAKAGLAKAAKAAPPEMILAILRIGHLPHSRCPRLTLIRGGLFH